MPGQEFRGGLADTDYAKRVDDPRQSDRARARNGVKQVLSFLVPHQIERKKLFLCQEEDVGRIGHK